MKLITSAVFPPIPTRQYDWSCTDDNYDIDGFDGELGRPTSSYPIGYGPTEFDAIVDFVRELLLRNDDAQEMLADLMCGAANERKDRLHYHTCQQCDKQISPECDCEKGNTVNMWCSSRCKAAYDL